MICTGKRRHELRRGVASRLGMDGSYDDDSASFTGTVSGTDQSSDSGYCVASAARRGSVAGGNEGSRLVIRRGLLSLLASLIVP